MWALVFPVRALIVPHVQYCRLVKRRSGENSGSGCWRRPLTGVGALPRYSQVCMYIGTTQRELNRPSHGYTTTTLLQWTAVKLGAKSGGCCLCNSNTAVLKKPLASSFHPPNRPSWIDQQILEQFILYCMCSDFHISLNSSYIIHISVQNLHTWWNQFNSILLN